MTGLLTFLCGPCRYALSLEQLPATRKISPHPKDWKCDDTGVTENLWVGGGCLRGQERAHISGSGSRKRGGGG